MKQIALLALGLLATLGVEAQTYKFDFTTGKKTKDGYTKITPADRYSEEKGYGYDRQPSLNDGGIPSEQGSRPSSRVSGRARNGSLANASIARR